METKEDRQSEAGIPFSTVFLAQQGDEDAMNCLWDNCRPFVRWLAGKWAPSSFYGENRWYDYDDLTQIGYLAFRKALEKWRPVKGAEFKKYFGHWLREYFRREVGISNSRRKEILKDSISLNQQSSATDSGLDNSKEEWIDFEEDPKALEAFERIEDFDFGRSVREQVDKLPDPEKTVVQNHHFKGMMLKTIAKKLDVSSTSAIRYLDNGYRMLRANPVIQVLYAEIRNPWLNPYEEVGLMAFRLNRMSSPEWDYMVGEAFRDDLVKIFNGEELEYDSE
ncbi:MAG TPA: hypothetical protein DIW17_04020 [Clostridiales bacterium]|nr:hypothetical protein [Clostridiales bacterium]